MNKTILALALALAIGISGIAEAQHDCGCNEKHAHGGYMDSLESLGAPSSVKQALTMPDESDVTLNGQIEKRIKKNKYTFTDNSGKITVKIDKDVWNGQIVTPKDTVTIRGELKKDDDKTMLKVDKLIKK